MRLSATLAETEQAAPVVVPFLLAGAGEATSHDRFADTLLFALLDDANSVGRCYGGEGLAAFRALVGAAEGRPGPVEAIPRDELLLSAQLLQALAARPPDEDERRRWLEVARETVDARVDAVVGGQHRGAFRRELRAAAAESPLL